MLCIDPTQTEFSQSRLLPWGYRGGWRSIGITRSGFDLTEHEYPPTSQDEINLAIAATPISVDNDIAMRFVPTCSQVFAVGPKGPATGCQPK